MKMRIIYGALVALLAAHAALAATNRLAGVEPVPGFTYVPNTSFEGEAGMGAVTNTTLRPRMGDAGRCAGACAADPTGRCKAFTFCWTQGRCLLFPRLPDYIAHMKRPTQTSTFSPECLSGTRLKGAAGSGGGGAAAPARAGASGVPQAPHAPRVSAGGAGVRSGAAVGGAAAAGGACRSMKLKNTFVDGHDLRSAPQGSLVANADGCCALCQTTRGCGAWTWNTGGGRRCFLKARAAAKSLKPAKGSWSGVVV